MARATTGPRRHALHRSCRFGGIVEDIRETQLSASPPPGQGSSFSPAPAPLPVRPLPAWASLADCGHATKALYADPLNQEQSCCDGARETRTIADRQACGTKGARHEPVDLCRMRRNPRIF